MTLLLNLYPRAWRQRYGAEVEEVIASQPWSLKLMTDLLAGAVDAHLKPQASARQQADAGVDQHGGIDMLSRLKSCGDYKGMTMKESLFSATIAILTGLVVAALFMFDLSQLTETIVLSMFPAALAAPTQWFYTRGYSKPARIVMMVLPIVACFLIGLIAGIIVSD